MFGSERFGEGQLALLDAIVFFVIAVLISSMLFYYADLKGTERPIGNPDGQSDPDAILRVFLHSSLGLEIMLDTNGGTRISANSEVAECIQIEMDALARGADVRDYEPLNKRLASILETTCSPVFSSYLVMTWLHHDAQETLLRIPCDPPRSSTRYAGSVEFPGPEESSYVLTLVLVPASLPEIADIGARYLYLGLGIGQAPADFHPRQGEQDNKQDDRSVEE